MSVKRDASGRRWVAVEIEVPGTPEEVWEAIATGPGVSSWFVPSDVDERVGGAVVAHFGPGLDSNATVTEWEPPRRFAAESGDLGPNAPAMATEWVVEAKSGGTCMVRVVHSLFASTDDWDDQIESIESGWPTFFRILKLYLTHFRGQPCAMVQLVGTSAEPRSAAWKTLGDSLGLVGLHAGARWSTPQRVPRMTGLVVQTGAAANHSYALVRLYEPAPGIASMIATSAGPAVYVQVSFYFYGQADAVVDRERALWKQWMEDRYPSAA